MKKQEIDALREKIYTVIFKTDTKAGKEFDIALLVVIIFSVLIAILESVVSVDNQFKSVFIIAEWVLTCVFSIEYLLRIFSAPNKKKYIFSFYGIIDFLAILPNFVGLILPTSHYLLVVRSLRLLRIFRILKLSRFVAESYFLAISLRRSFTKIFIFIYFIVIIVIILGSIMYIVEGGVNPSFSNIPKSIYWAVVTITTVGYGDITPITYTGQFISVIVMLLGYAIIAVPTGIVSSEMIKSFRRKDAQCSTCKSSDHEYDSDYCRHCGARLAPSVETEISKKNKKK